MKAVRGTGARYLSVAGFAEGVRLSLQAIPVKALFGTAYGAFAAQKGLGLLEALPGALVVAMVLPIAVKIGVIAFLAITAAAVVMVLRHNGFLAIVSGLIVAALARSVGL